MKKTLFLIFAALMSFVSMSAQEQKPVSTEEIVLDSEDAVAEFNYSSGVHAFFFTPTIDGTVEFFVGWSSVYIDATDRAYSNTSRSRLNSYDTDLGHTYYYEVEAGKTYYFLTSVLSDPLTITVRYGTGDPGISVTSNMDNGAVYSLGGSNLELTLDREVNVDKFLISFIGIDGQPVEEEIKTEYINGTSNYYQFDLYNLMDYLMDAGKIDFGTEFTITLKGIADAKDPDKIYGTDGTYQITLELGEQPVSLKSVDPAVNSNIYTYYPEDGEDGLITFTFTDELDATIKDEVNVKVSYGYMEAGSYRELNPEFTISGNTVVVDLRGIMFPESVEGSRGTTAQATQITVSISGLKAKDGRPVQTNTPTSGTSAVVVSFYVVKEEIIPHPAWFPDPSRTLVYGTDREVTFYIDVPIMYDGVTMTYWDGSGSERTKQLTAEDAPLVWDDEMDMYAIKVSIRGTSFYNDGIILTITNARLMNGDEMNFTAKYKGSKTATAIEGVEVGADDSDKVVKVYGIDGTFIKEGAAGTVLNGLPKGLYITNGKKVMVK